MSITYHKPCDGSEAAYSPETEGYFIVKFKAGVNREDLALPTPPFPPNSFLQLATGWVGTPRPSMEMAQRDLCAVHARYPQVARHVEICKCPCALAEASAFVPLTDAPDPRIIELAKTVAWTWWMAVEDYNQGKGRFALQKAA
jgi:hypothetical protein